MELELTRLGLLSLAGKLLQVLELHAVGVGQVVGLLDARDICQVQEQVPEIIEETILVVVHLSQVLLTLRQTRVRKSSHHRQQEDTNIVESDMIADFSGKILPYPHDYIIVLLVDIL